MMYPPPSHTLSVPNARSDSYAKTLESCPSALENFEVSPSPQALYPTYLTIDLILNEAYIPQLQGKEFHRLRYLVHVYR